MHIDKATRRPSATSPRANPGAALEHDAVRAMLILWVILDHNDIVRNVGAVNAWFEPMTFHVAGFLLLPFVAPARPLTWPRARDLATRYLVPFAASVLVYAVAYRLLIVRAAPDLLWIGQVAAALAVAATQPLQTATGYVLLWFLPALLTTTLLAQASAGARPPVRAAILAAGLVAHCTVAAAPESLLSSVPQGLLIALWMLPQGLLAREIAPLLRSRAAWVAALAPAVVIACAALEWGVEIEIATLHLPTAAEPIRLLSTDVSDLAYFSLILAVAPWVARSRTMVAVGRESLLIYLIHPLLYKLLFAVLVPVSLGLDRGAAAGWAEYWAVAAFSAILVTALSLGAATGLRRLSAFDALVTPRDWASWLPVRALRG